MSLALSSRQALLRLLMHCVHICKRAVRASSLDQPGRKAMQPQAGVAVGHDPTSRDPFISLVQAFSMIAHRGIVVRIVTSYILDRSSRFLLSSRSLKICQRRACAPQSLMAQVMQTSAVLNIAEVGMNEVNRQVIERISLRH
jgi:hypothetical protein